MLCVLCDLCVEGFLLDEQTKIREAIAKLTEVLAGIARTADDKNRERCPYKTADLRCTYSGGCRNQVWDRLPSAGSTHQLWDRLPSAGPTRGSRVTACAGDYLNFDPCALSPTPSALL